MSFPVLLLGSIAATVVVFFASNDTADWQGPPIKTCECDCKRVDCVPGVQIRGLPGDLDKMTINKARRIVTPAILPVDTDYESWIEGEEVATAAKKVNTDIGISPKLSVHDFGPMYQKSLQPFRDTGLEYKVLELGIHGAQTFAFFKAYAPNLMYRCVDVSAKLGAAIDQMKGLTDADKKHLKENCVAVDGLAGVKDASGAHGPFDVIIDDGSVGPLFDQATTFKTMFPLLAPSGAYIVENLQHSFAPKQAAQQTTRTTMVDLVKDLHIALQYDWWKTDNLRQVTIPFTLYENLAEWVQSIDCDREICVIRKRHKAIRRL